MSKLARQNGQLLSELAEASAVLESLSTLAIQIHALFLARPQRPVQRGRDISSLPNELLAHIFEEAVPQAEGFTATSQILSHVCRRWRLVALDLPSLWVEADFAHYPSEYITCLGKSRNAPLKIHMVILDDCDIEEFLNAIIPHSKRWSRLVIDIVNQEACREVISFMDTQHATHDLPLLKELKIEYREEIGGDLEGNHTILFSKWSMPNLQSLYMKGYLSPHQIPLDATFGTNLVRCSFQFDGEVGLERILFACLDFLQHHPSLEEFQLSLLEIFEVSGSSFTPVTLPNLRTLLISLSPLITESAKSIGSMALFMGIYLAFQKP